MYVQAVALAMRHFLEAQLVDSSALQEFRETTDNPGSPQGLKKCGIPQTARPISGDCITAELLEACRQEWAPHPHAHSQVLHRPTFRRRPQIR